MINMLAFSFPLSCLLDRFGLIHQARISASVNAMRILNTGMEVEAAVADALVRMHLLLGFLCDATLIALIHINTWLTFST